MKQLNWLAAFAFAAGLSGCAPKAVEEPPVAPPKPAAPAKAVPAPDAAKPAETKPADAKPADAKPADAPKADGAKDGAKPAETKTSAVPNTVCPVMKGKPVKAEYSVDYKGRKVQFCCKMCIAAFNKDPEKYIAVLDADSAKPAKPSS